MSRKPALRSVATTARWRAMHVKAYSAREQQEAIEALSENVNRLIGIVQGLEAVPPAEVIPGANIEVVRGDVQGQRKFKVSAVLPDAAEAVLGRVVINVDTIPIPPYSAMEIASVNADGSANVRRPTADELAAPLVLFSALGTINAGEAGRGFSAYDFDAETIVDGTPVVGDSVGTQEDEFELVNGKSGFIYQGDTVASSRLGTVRPSGGGGDGIVIAKILSRTGDRTYSVSIYSRWEEDWTVSDTYKIEGPVVLKTPTLNDTATADRLTVGTIFQARKADIAGTEYYVPVERVGLW